MIRFLIVLLALAAGQAAAGETLRALPEIRVGGRDVRLADAVVGPLPEALRPALTARVLASGLRIGEPREIGRQALLLAWRSALGAAADQWSLQAPERIVAVRVDGEPAGGRLRAAAEEALRQRLLGDCTRLELKPRDGDVEAMLPLGSLRLIARVPASPLLARRMAVWVDAFEGDALYRSWPQWFDVACYRSAWRSRVELARGDSLMPDKVEQVDVDVAAIDHPLAAAAGMMATRVLPVGSLLRQEDVAALPLVRKGAHVVARVRSGAVQLELASIAAGDGAAGDVVYAKPERGGEAFKATVAVDGALDVM